MVTERLKYCMYAIAPLTVAFAIAMLADGTASSKEFRSPSKGRKNCDKAVLTQNFRLQKYVRWNLLLRFSDNLLIHRRNRLEFVHGLQCSR